MFKMWFSLRLHIQLALASGVLLAITIAITTWLNIQSQKKELLQNTTSEVVSLAKNISIISSYLVLTNKLDELESLLIQSTSFPLISQIRVLSEEGNTLSHTKKRLSGEVVVDFELSKIKLPNTDKVVKSQVNWKQKMLVIWQPIRTSTLLGWIKLDVSLNEVVRLQNKMIRDNIISAVIAIICDLIVLLGILYIPAKSFRQVVNFAKNMSDNPGKK